MNKASTRLACLASIVFALAACGGGDDATTTPAPTPAPGPAPDPSAPQAVVTPVGSAQGSPSSASLNGAGGSLSSPDGKLKITVPEGALSATTTLSIQPLSNGAPGRVGSGYRLSPEGVTFAKPVQLSFAYADADVAGSSAEALGVATQQANGTWRWEGGALDAASRTVNVNTSHFSDWTLVKGLQLSPSKASVKTKGSVPLKLVFCFPASVDGDNLAPLGMDCDNPEAPAPLNRVVNWSVNGNPGGNSAVGSVTGNGGSATYTAPAQKPSANPVAVSAEVQGVKGKMLVVSNITVTGEAAAYSGSISGTMTMPDLTTSYQSNGLHFVQVELLPNDLTKYAARGSVTMTFTVPGQRPVTQTMDLSGESGTLIVYDPVRAGTAFAGKYWFALMGLINTCPEEVAAGAVVSYGSDPDTLEGSRSITCAVSDGSGGGGSVGFSSQWSLKASE